MAQELVRRGETRVLGAGEQAFIAQAEQGQLRAAMPHPGLAAPMKALEALHQEFDIANAARRELYVEAGIGAAPGCHFLADPLPRLGDAFDGAKVERALIDERLDEIEQRGSGLPLAGGNTRLDEHLFFPVPRALFVIDAG